MWIMDGNVHPDAVKHNMYIIFKKSGVFHCLVCCRCGSQNRSNGYIVYVLSNHVSRLTDSHCVVGDEGWFFLTYFVFCKLILLIFVLLASKLLEIVSRITSNHPQVFVYPIIFAHLILLRLKYWLYGRECSVIWGNIDSRWERCTSWKWFWRLDGFDPWSLQQHCVFAKRRSRRRYERKST